MAEIDQIQGKTLRARLGAGWQDFSEFLRVLGEKISVDRKYYL